MKSNKKVLIIFIAIIVLSTTIVNAQTLKKQLNVVYGVAKKIVIDGVDKTPTTTTNQPFVYEGTTYVPLRYISESLGKEVTWEAKTGTIFIGEEKEEYSYFYKKPIAESTEDLKIREDIKGISLFSEFSWWNYHLAKDTGGKEYSYNNQSVTYNLNGEVDMILGTICMLEEFGRNYNSEANGYVNGKLIAYDDNDNIIYESEKIRLMSDEINFKINAKNLLKIRFELYLDTYNKGNATIAIKNLRYK